MGLVAALALAGCGQSSVAAKSQRIAPGTRVILIGPSKEAPQSEALTRAFLDYWKGVEVVRATSAAPRDRSAAALCDAARAARDEAPAAMAICTEDAAALHQCIALLPGVRIVVTVGPAFDEPHIFSQVRSDSAASARLLGETLSRVVPDGTGFLLFSGDPHDTQQTAARDAFEAAARRASDVTLLERVELAQSGMDDAQLSDAVVGALQQFRSVRVLVALDPGLAARLPGVTFAALRRVNPRVQFVTRSTAPCFWPALRAGEALALVGPNDAQCGRAAARMIYRGLTGGDTPEPQVVEPEAVTLETLDRFEQDYDAIDGDGR